MASTSMGGSTVTDHEHEACDKGWCPIRHRHCAGCAEPMFDPGTFTGTFAGIFGEAFAILCERQRKYGPGNIERQGLYGVVTRIVDDKAERLRRALNGTIVAGRVDLDLSDGPDDDTFEDALLDVINYCAIALSLRRGKWGTEIADDEKGRLVLA